MGQMTLKEWHEQQFLPWKDAVAKVLDARKVQAARMHRHMGQLQAIVALLLDGKTKQALLAWNTLRLHPALRDIKMGEGGETLTLLDMSGRKSVLRLDDLIDDLQAMLDAPVGE